MALARADGGSEHGLREGSPLKEGRYVVDCPISSGAMGEVLRAQDTETGEPVAIKRLLDVSQLERFEIEARLLSQLSHPRVVRVLDHFDDPTGYFLVMELVRGPDLAAILAREGSPGLPLERVLCWAEEACEALAYVHAQRIVHRDIKPQNLLDATDGLVVVDFGVARQLGERESGTVGIGTPRYMAPEIFAGGAVSERADVFSLSATLFALLTGKQPSYGDRRPMRDMAPEVTPEIEAALRAGMEFMPERRLASVTALAEALGRNIDDDAGVALVTSARDGHRSALLEAVVNTAAGVFDAAAASMALTDADTGELVYVASWGAGAKEVVGMRLPHGAGIAGSVVTTGEAVAVPECRHDPRFAEAIARGTGYVPVTMLVVPLVNEAKNVVGVLSLLDRRDGGPYGAPDITKASHFANLAVVALQSDIRLRETLEQL